MIIVYGSGVNGKFIFWNIIVRVFGNYLGKFLVEVLIMSVRWNVSLEMVEFKGKCFIIVLEMSEGMWLNIVMVK